jgi:LytS/YehU family sensor histidine kinase
MKQLKFCAITCFLLGIGLTSLAKDIPTDTIVRLDNPNNYVRIDLNELKSFDSLIIQINQTDKWYTQTWVIVTSVLLLGFIAFLVFRYFLSSSRKNALAKVRIADLERSALQAQMNPHFIFNSLNSIQSYIANNENDKASRYLAKFSRLVRATLNNSRSGKITLDEEIEAVTHYLELEKMRFKEKFDYDITIDDDIVTSEIQLPPMLIQPYLENAIIHGLAQTRSKGRISLYYLLIGNYLVVTVTDNGIGIEQSKKLKEGNTSLHKSVGMTITQKRLEMLDEGNRDSKVKIEEVKDRLNEVIGTKVEVKIRVN